MAEYTWVQVAKRFANVCQPLRGLERLTEPFMTRDFADRLDAVRRHGVPFSDVFTNGTLLNERSVAKILDAQTSRFIFSIDGGTKSVYEGIRVGAVI